MVKVDIQQLPDGIDQGKLAKSVEEYAAANPVVSSATVSFVAKDKKGKDVAIQGAYTRSPLGEVVFMVLAEAAKRVVRHLRARKVDRQDVRNARRVAKGKAPLKQGQRTLGEEVLAATVEVLFDQKVAKGLIKELGNDVFAVVGGLTFKGKQAVLDSLADELAAQQKAVAGAVAKEAKAKKAAPKKAAAKAAPKKAAAKAAPKKAAAKKAAPKKAAGKK